MPWILILPHVWFHQLGLDDGNYEKYTTYYRMSSNNGWGLYLPKLQTFMSNSLLSIFAHLLVRSLLVCLILIWSCFLVPLGEGGSTSTQCTYFTPSPGQFFSPLSFFSSCLIPGLNLGLAFTCLCQPCPQLLMETPLLIEYRLLFEEIRYVWVWNLKIKFVCLRDKK